MVKSRFAALFSVTAALTVLIAGWAPTNAQASGAPDFRTIVRLEQGRSLGNGALAGFLQERDPIVAARAALAIGRTKQRAGIPLLRAHLADRNAGVRAMSVYGLGLLADAATAPKLLQLVSSDPSGAVRVAALDALNRFETAKRLAGNVEARAAGKIVLVLRHSPDPILRERAAAALEAFRDGGSATAVARGLAAAFSSERNADVRWHIVWTIYRAYPQRVPRATLAAALRDNSELVRIEAVRAYGRLKNADAIAALTPLLNDSSWRVQEQTIESIKALRGEPLTDHLTQIPSGIHVPKPIVQNFMELAPLPRPTFTGKPSAPNADEALDNPKLTLASSASMNGPMPGPHPQVRIKTTKGTIVVELFPEWAPLTVANFLNLTNRGYYDGNRWFRIVPDFVAQTGDPNDNGEGDAGYTIGAEENPLEQSSYILSMGMNYNKSGPIRDSAGTQFYITLSPQLHLDRDFTVFGRVVAGFDVLGRLIESDRMIRVEQIPDSK
ncbi:MAG: peptidylprolyl isomerase [Candidatus Eremiobacteraeota bacterium]|nr:peptidylprolyl isomerase [Candidatus Eremiobacteraeota bacterium]